MTYGSVTQHTREWLTLRAEQSGISLDALGLEPDFDQWFDENDELKPDVELPSNLYMISVIFGGALDEEFYVLTNHEVNIADWLAEDCRNEVEKQPGESWEIIVTEYMHEDAGPVRYRISDEMGS